MLIICISTLLLLSCDSNNPNAPTSYPEIIYGCNNQNACNYVENCDVCDSDELGNTSDQELDLCIYTKDCNDVCGGDAIEDDCGVCDGDGSTC